LKLKLFEKVGILYSVPKKIILDLHKEESKFKPHLPFIIGLVLLTIVVFAFGYWFGILGEGKGFFPKEKVATESSTRQNWFVLEVSKFSIEYPESWKAEATSSENTADKISNESGQIEIWLEKPFDPRFSKEQTKQQKDKKESVVEIDGRDSSQTEYVYINGEVFLIVEVPQVGKKKKVTFWVAANDEETKVQAIEIIKTYKGK